jgi:hypothetical protein
MSETNTVYLILRLRGEPRGGSAGGSGGGCCCSDGGYRSSNGGCRHASSLAPAWEMPELGPNDLAFVAGRSLVIAARGRVPVLCPQADSVACFSADQEEIVFSMRNKMAYELCGPSKSPESFAVFVLSADHSTMERVDDGEKIRDRRNVAAIFIIEDYGAPSL